jgi:hypothetical protein
MKMCGLACVAWPRALHTLPTELGPGPEPPSQDSAARSRVRHSTSNPQNVLCGRCGRSRRGIHDALCSADAGTSRRPCIRGSRRARWVRVLRPQVDSRLRSRGPFLERARFSTRNPGLPCRSRLKPRRCLVQCGPSAPLISLATPCRARAKPQPLLKRPQVLRSWLWCADPSCWNQEPLPHAVRCLSGRTPIRNLLMSSKHCALS